MNREKQFKVIYNEYGDRIYRLCKSYLYHPEWVEDLYQEVWHNIWRSLDSYSGTSGLGTWVYRVTVNTAITFNKKEKRRQAVMTGMDPTELAHSIAGASDESAAASDVDLLYACVSRLRPDERLVMSLLLEGLAYKEIALVLGISANYAGVKISRAKQQLTKLMKEEA